MVNFNFELKAKPICKFSPYFNIQSQKCSILGIEMCWVIPMSVCDVYGKRVVNYFRKRESIISIESHL